jgi:hypothetical protein
VNFKQASYAGLVFLIGVLLIGIVLRPDALLAHHGSAVSYDNDAKKLITMKGVVTEWVWKNPHCFIIYEVKEGDGQAVQWTAETSSTSSMMGEFGWSRTTLKPGDQITVSVFPSRAGTPAGLLYKVVASDGKVMIEDKSRLREDQR